MAFTIFASKGDLIRVEMPDFWQLSYPVYPNLSSSRSDILLLQGLLVQLALSNTLPEPRKTEAGNIVTSMGGRRFDDGIYGPRTRALMKIFEDHVDSPVKDGIIRPLPTQFLFIPGLKVNTKLGALNDIWDFTKGENRTKRESAKQLHPDLQRDLY